jgi:hypothetical protein
MTEGSTTLTDSNGAWGADEWAGQLLTTSDGKCYKVKSNTATCLTCRPYRWYERAWDWMVGKVRTIWRRWRSGAPHHL